MSNQEIEKIIQHAENALAVEADKVEFFLEKVALYLDQLELWRSKIKGVNLSQDNDFKLALDRLKVFHNEVTTRAINAKDLVSGELADVSRRAGALRAYVDHAPHRVTVTGKREG